MNTNRTFQELLEAIRVEMQLDPGLISDVERKTFLNDALKEVGTIGLFEKMADVTPLAGIADLPDDIVVLLDVFWEGNLLRPMPNRTGTGDASSAPVGYVVRFDKIELIPHPASGKATIHYAYRPGSMVNPTDKPAIPNGWDYMLVDYAVGRAHRKNGNIGLYREYVSSFERAKADLALELITRQNSRVTETVNNMQAENPSTPFDFL